MSRTTNPNSITKQITFKDLKEKNLVDKILTDRAGQKGISISNVVSNIVKNNVLTGNNYVDRLILRMYEADDFAPKDVLDGVMSFIRGGIIDQNDFDFLPLLNFFITGDKVLFTYKPFTKAEQKKVSDEYDVVAETPVMLAMLLFTDRSAYSRCDILNAIDLLLGSTEKWNTDSARIELTDSLRNCLKMD